MAENRVERRLAAILSADVAGFARIMGQDEEGTLTRLQEHRRELVYPKLDEHHGRIVKTTGDGILAEFGSAVDAVRCAVEVQSRMAERNAPVSADRRIEFRIGINFGDILIEGDDIYGDGVNIAARLEALAQPGGIYISQTMHSETRGKLPFEVEDVGEQMLKNIARPIRIFRVLFEGAPMGTPLPIDRPSIAVLPFQNMGDPDHDFFADGITEDIITALSKFRWFSVTARTSSFVYKGRAIDVKRVGHELGVRYLVEGSVRKIDNRVRITGQLIDTSTGNHLWAQRYDREVVDFFAVQDEITESVVGAIEPELQHSEFVRSRLKTAEEIDAYDVLQRTRYNLIYNYWREIAEVANELRSRIIKLRETINRVPDVAELHVNYARAVIGGILYGGGGSDEMADWSEAEHAALRALTLDGKDATAPYVLARCLHAHGDTEGALAAARKAIDLNPNFAVGHGRLGQILAFAGRFEEAIASLDLCLRMSPNDSQISVWATHKGWALYLLGRYDEALAAAFVAKRHRALPFVYRLIIACYGQLGRREEAAVAIAEARRVEFEGIYNSLTRPFGYSNPAHNARMEEGWRKAGLIE
jgi:adenylate cyclase